MKSDTLKLLEENIGNTLQNIVGKNYVNRNLFAQEFRQTITSETS